jgi:hypothetical protein
MTWRLLKAISRFFEIFYLVFYLIYFSFYLVFVSKKLKTKTNNSFIELGFKKLVERELGLHLVPIYFWWLNCPTQIFGLTSLPKCIDYTGVKGSHSANKKTKFWIQ